MENSAAPQLKSLEAEVLKTLSYFDYFSFPLDLQQLRFYLGIKADEAAVATMLKELVAAKRVQCSGDLYSLSSIEPYAESRRAGEARLAALQGRIDKSCERIRRFPFILFVGLSGSMSKGYAPEDADIDFFLVTQKNRLWICKIVLHLMKTLSRVKGSQKWYCLNYYIDDTALRLEEQNEFTAVELASLKPLIDAGNYYEQFIAANRSWLETYLPNFELQRKERTFTTRKTWWGSMIASLSSDTLNKWVMKLTDGEWRKRRKRNSIPAEYRNVVIKTRVNISKRHYRNFQKKMLDHQSQVCENM
ncbi:MAG TPA: hypothetical protein VL092_01850 [Chitinophagaceae bacterium]|nr:hypothetical protein [Chitinophagaceae bacterium]